jgi:hypothetical protein
MIVGGTGTQEFFTRRSTGSSHITSERERHISFADICAIILNTLIIVLLASIGYSICHRRAVAIFRVSAIISFAHFC